MVDWRRFISRLSTGDLLFIALVLGIAIGILYFGWRTYLLVGAYK